MKIATQDGENLQEGKKRPSHGRIGFRTLFVGKFGSHLSFKALIETPLPTLKQWPDWRIGIAAIKLLHTNEQLRDSFASRKFDLGKYLALKHLYSNESLPRTILQPCLANIARLKALKSRNPIPPSFFETVSLSQLFQWIFRSLPTWSRV